MGKAGEVIRLSIVALTIRGGALFNAPASWTAAVLCRFALVPKDHQVISTPLAPFVGKEPFILSFYILHSAFCLLPFPKVGRASPRAVNG